MEQPIYRGPDAAARLAALGLDAAVIQAAVMAGETHRRACTGNDPGLMKAILRWGKMLGSLRESLFPLGWRRGCEGGYETVQEPDRQISIVVMSGDAATATDRRPRSNHPKGEHMARAILANNNGQTTFSLFSSEPVAPALRLQTWCLLVHTAKDELRFELSVPMERDRSGHVAAWGDRIVFDPIPREDPPIGRVADDEEDFDIDVMRKAE